MIFPNSPKFSPAKNIQDFPRGKISGKKVKANRKIQTGGSQNALSLRLTRWGVVFIFKQYLGFK